MLIFIALFLWFFLLGERFKKQSIVMIGEIKTNFRFFPKYYILPPRWMRKWFKLKKEEIPRFLFLRLLGSIVYKILSLITPFVYLFEQSKPIAVYIICSIALFLGLLDTIVFVIMSLVFKRK